MTRARPNRTTPKRVRHERDRASGVLNRQRRRPAPRPSRRAPLARPPHRHLSRSAFGKGLQFHAEQPVTAALRQPRHPRRPRSRARPPRGRAHYQPWRQLPRRRGRRAPVPCGGRHDLPSDGALLRHRRPPGNLAVIWGLYGRAGRAGHGGRGAVPARVYSTHIGAGENSRDAAAKVGALGRG